MTAELPSSIYAAELLYYIFQTWNKREMGWSCGNGTRLRSRGRFYVTLDTLFNLRELSFQTSACVFYLELAESQKLWGVFMKFQNS